MMMSTILRWCRFTARDCRGRLLRLRHLMSGGHRVLVRYQLPRQTGRGHARGLFSAFRQVKRIEGQRFRASGPISLVERDLAHTVRPGTSAILSRPNGTNNSQVQA
jgi:hypothetical protein